MTDYLPDPDMNLRADPYGTPSKKEPRQLSPAMDKAITEFSPLKSFARSAANTALFGGGDRLASWIKGAPVEDIREISARAREQNPRSSTVGDVTGTVLRELPMAAAGAIAAPVRLGASTAAAGARLGGLTSGAGALAEEAIKAAEGDRGNFSPGNVVGSTIGGILGGGIGNQLPAVVGHARTMLSKTAPAPLNVTQKMGLDLARDLSTRRGFAGDAALDIAQNARLSGDRSMSQMAANMERIKGRANPYFKEVQENAFRAGGLDKFMDASVPRGTNKYSDIAGKPVGQARNTIPETTILPTRGDIPEAAQRALDQAYEARRSLWETQNKHGTWGKDVGPRPEPQRGEFKMWEDVLDPTKNPMSREDLFATRRALSGDSSPMSQRMYAEQLSDDVARVRDAVHNAPATPSNMPGSLPLSAGIPFLKRWLGSINTNIPTPSMAARNTRAAELMRDPSMADIIGKLTGAQGVSSAVSRATLEELIQSLNQR